MPWPGQLRPFWDELKKLLKVFPIMTKQTYLALVFLFSYAIGAAQNTPPMSVLDSKNLIFRGVAELGFVGVLAHNIQFSNSGTRIDYVTDGGQDVLFPVSRLSLELEIKQKHTLTFLYQPLRLESTALLSRDLIIDELTFPAGTSVDFLYNFPFFRLSYMKELAPKKDKFDFAFGLSLQIRNATISFESTDGTLFRSNRDIGPVPILKFRTRYSYNSLTYTEIEADGFYAPVSYLNGSDNEVIGAILDASLRQGLKVSPEVGTFLNLRYLGGGAVGTSDDDPGPGDGYVRNWLNFLTVTAGFSYEFN
ncbi:MAG: hypothetical protein D6722_17180 [Bacteroidetes bacterium]|nr:MAG: hypothetical protein D6722_17180 [Bacteroidota bacterium]